MKFLSKKKETHQAMPIDVTNDSIKVMVEDNLNENKIQIKNNSTSKKLNTDIQEIKNDKNNNKRDQNLNEVIEDELNKNKYLDTINSRKSSTSSSLKDEPKIETNKSSSDDFKDFKKFTLSFVVLLLVYIFGYFQFSFAWILATLIIVFIRFVHRKKRKKKLLANQELALDEKKVIEKILVDLPNWVYFPDSERVEWINKMIKQIWPFLDLYVQKMLKESVLPGIIAYLPDYMKGVRFETIELGTVPLRIGSIKCHTDRSSRKEILLDMQILYAGNSRFTLKCFKFTAGIKDLQLFGMLRVRFYPLIEHIPLIGAISCTFLNCPSFDFNLTNIADVFDLPGVSDIIRKAIMNQIVSYIVYPNVFVIPMTDIPMKTLKFSPPLGVIRLEIIEARELMKSDYGMLGMGKSDPYCKLYLSSFTLQTQVIPNTVNPQWNFICEVAIGDLDDQEIIIEVYDQDQGTADDFLGRTTIKLADFDCSGLKSHWIPLEDTTTGSLHIKMTWLKLSTNLNRLEKQLKDVEKIKTIYANQMQLIKAAQQKSSLSYNLNEITFGNVFCCMIYVDCIRHLPKLGQNQVEPSTFVEIILGSRKNKTITVESNCNPVFEQNFLFLCDQFKNEPLLKFEINDAKMKKVLGTTVIKLENLVKENRLSFDKPIFVQIGQKFDCTLRVAIEIRLLYQSEFKQNIKSTNKPKKVILDKEDENIIQSERPVKDQIPSLDDMIMSTIKPFIKTMEYEPKQNQRDISPTRVKKSINNVQPKQLEEKKSSNVKDQLDSSNKRISLNRPDSLNEIKSFKKPKIYLTLQNLNDPNFDPVSIIIHKVENLVYKSSKNSFYFVSVRRFPTRNKKKFKTKKIYHTDSPLFNECFTFLNSRKNPLIQLEIRIFKGKKYPFNFKLTKQISRVVINLTEYDESTLTKSFDLEDIPKLI